MANITSNPAAGQLSGVVGDLVFARLRNGKVVVRRRGTRRTPKRDGECTNQQGFARAVIYATQVWNSQPELRAKYTAVAQRQGRNAFNLAKGDFLVSPKVGDIDLSVYQGNPGDTIRIVATDDFAVKQVQVLLRRLTGEFIEQGPAVLEQGAWCYRPQIQVPAGETITVEAIATDWPGHAGSKRVDHACGPRAG